MDIIKETKIFMDKELADLNKIKANPPKWLKLKDAVYNSISRSLGVAFFAQQLGGNFEDIDKIYNNFRDKALDLLKN